MQEQTHSITSSARRSASNHRFKTCQESGERYFSRVKNETKRPLCAF